MKCLPLHCCMSAYSWDVCNLACACAKSMRENKHQEILVMAVRMLFRRNGWRILNFRTLVVFNCLLLDVIIERKFLNWIMLNKHTIWRYRYLWKIYYRGCLTNAVWIDVIVTVSMLLWWWAFVYVAEKRKFS
jgi:hypothetical protein